MTRQLPARESPVIRRIAARDDEVLAWMESASRKPGITYVTHGELDAADTLRGRIEHELGCSARVPEHLERATLERRL